MEKIIIAPNTCEEECGYTVEIPDVLVEYVGSKEIVAMGEALAITNSDVDPGTLTAAVMTCFELLGVWLTDDSFEYEGID
jgi:hypothetical protein